MLVMRGGQLVESRSLLETSALSGRISLRAGFAASVNAAQVQAAITTIASVELLQCEGGQALFAAAPEPAVRIALLQALVQAGLPVSSFADERENLHQSYLKTMHTAATQKQNEQSQS